MKQGFFMRGILAITMLMVLPFGTSGGFHELPTQHHVASAIPAGSAAGPVVSPKVHAKTPYEQFTGSSSSPQVTMSASYGSAGATAPAPQQPVQTGCPGNIAPCGQLTYHGGAVLHNAQNFLIFWLPPGVNPVTQQPYTLDNPQIDTKATNPFGASDGLYKSLIIQYFNDVCNSRFYLILNQYQDALGSTGPCSGACGSTHKLLCVWVDTQAFPGGRGTITQPLKDEDIHDQIDRARSVNGWSLSPQAAGREIFFVFLPFAVYECTTVTILATFYGGCSFIPKPPGVAGGNAPFCAYHSFYPVVAFGGPTPLTAYAVIPDQGTTPAPAGSCISALPGSPNGDPFIDSTISEIAHEQFETVTDPYPWPTGGWFFKDVAHEIGDECNLFFGVGQEPDSSDVVLHSYGATYDPYIIQYMWDNLHSGCSADLSGSPLKVTIRLLPDSSTGVAASLQSFPIAFQEPGDNAAVTSITYFCCGITNVFVSPETNILISPVIGSTSWCFDDICSIQSAHVSSSIILIYYFYQLVPEDPYLNLLPSVSQGGSPPEISLMYLTAPSCLSFCAGVVDYAQTVALSLRTSSQHILAVSGTTANAPQCLPTAPSSCVSYERWYAPHCASTTIGSNYYCMYPVSSEDSITNLDYWHQFFFYAWYSVYGGGSPTTPTLLSTQFGAGYSKALTTSRVGVGYWLDSGAAWSVTNPLGGSSSNERWWTSQITSGHVHIYQILFFAYSHQYYLTVQVAPNETYEGTVSPRSGWQNAGASVGISAAAKSGYGFEAWFGEGTGSYSGSSTSDIITVNSPIFETAAFLCVLRCVYFTITSNPAKPLGPEGPGPERIVSFYVLVDGVVYATFPQASFLWVVGSKHTIEGLAPASCYGVSSLYCRYVFSGWSDGGGQSHTITTPGSPTTYTVTYQKQFFLTVKVSPSNHGAVYVVGQPPGPVSGWYNAGKTVALIAKPNFTFRFLSWSGAGSGSYTGINNPTTITVNGPIIEIANFT